MQLTINLTRCTLRSQIFLVQRTRKIMTCLSYHSSNLSLIALKAMQLLVLILWNSFWENLFGDLCWNSADSMFKSVSVAWQIKCSRNTTTNFKYLKQQILERIQSPLQLTWQPDFNSFQAANQCHKSAKLDLVGT